MKAMPKILKKHIPGWNNVSSESGRKKSFCLNRFILQTLSRGKLPISDYCVIFFFWIERFFIRNRMPAQVDIGEQCSDMWFSDFNVLPEQAEEKEETWWREIKRRQERNKSRQERESSLSLYRHAYFLYFPNSLFPFIDFFSLIWPIFRRCVYKEKWNMELIHNNGKKNKAAR